MNKLLFPLWISYLGYNKSTMKVTILFLLATLIMAISAMHVLPHFNKDVDTLRDLFKKRQTSKVFSIFMKMLIHTHTLQQQMKLPISSEYIPANDKTCGEMLEELVGLFSTKDWINIYHQIYPRLNQLQMSCTNADFEEKGSSNGFDNQCALCTVISRVVENYVTYHRKDVAQFVENDFCSLFDGLIKPTCEAVVHYLGPHLIKGILNKENSDVICAAAGMCHNPKCRIIDTRSSEQFNDAVAKLGGDIIPKKMSKPSPWQWLEHLFVDHFGNNHNSPFDVDNDTFSDVSTFRGYHWKGNDCNQFDGKVYPGRKVGNTIKDHDCNSIFGKDSKGHSLQEKLCGNSTRLGVVVAGDSAGAHFSIPQKFFNVTMMKKGTFSDLLPRIADQLDLPYESAYTGHTKTVYQTHSIYKKLRKWNLCNHNDFQNLGVNGGDSGNTWGNIKALHRDPKNDHPVLFFLELIGNDVCGSNPTGYTPVQHFRENILRLLNWLDDALPKGSHVFILGLADGDLLADNLLGHTHPLDVKYDQVYDFLNCLKISPCAGWLNSNHTIRLQTSAWAKKLSNVYKEILTSGISFKNYDYAYYDFPTKQIFNKGILENKRPQQLIEPCDGFHPSGLFNSYLADWLWYKITTQHPQWIGDQNPNNQQIKNIFGLEDLE